MFTVYLELDSFPRHATGTGHRIHKVVWSIRVSRTYKYLPYPYSFLNKHCKICCNILQNLEFDSARLHRTSSTGVQVQGWHDVCKQ